MPPLKHHRIHVKTDQRGVPLGNLLRILDKYPNATFAETTIYINLGEEEETGIVEPVTEAESAASRRA
jgi:hypothetical protein